MRDAGSKCATCRQKYELLCKLFLILSFSRTVIHHLLLDDNFYYLL